MREGDFEAACAELCGVGHHIMRGEVRSNPQRRLGRGWSGDGGKLDAATRLIRSGHNV